MSFFPPQGAPTVNADITPSTVKTGNGSESSPAIGPSADADTGIYFGGNDIYFTSGGTLAAWVDTSSVGDSLTPRFTLPFESTDDGTATTLGKQVQRLWASQAITLSGASTATSNLIGQHARILYVQCYVVTTITGATSWDAGDGTDVDLYGAGLALAATTSADPSTYTAALPGISGSVQNITLTANGSNFTGGRVLVTVHYEAYV